MSTSHKFGMWLLSKQKKYSDPDLAVFTLSIIVGCFGCLCVLVGTELKPRLKTQTYASWPRKYPEVTPSLDEPWVHEKARRQENLIRTYTYQLNNNQ